MGGDYRLPRLDRTDWPREREVRGRAQVNEPPVTTNWQPGTSPKPKLVPPQLAVVQAPQPSLVDSPEDVSLDAMASFVQSALQPAFQKADSRDLERVAHEQLSTALPQLVAAGKLAPPPGVPVKQWLMTQTAQLSRLAATVENLRRTAIASKNDPELAVQRSRAVFNLRTDIALSNGRPAPRLSAAQADAFRVDQERQFETTAKLAQSLSLDMTDAAARNAELARVSSLTAHARSLSSSTTAQFDGSTNASQRGQEHLVQLATGDGIEQIAPGVEALEQARIDYESALRRSKDPADLAKKRTAFEGAYEQQLASLPAHLAESRGRQWATQAVDSALHAFVNVAGMFLGAPGLALGGAQKLADDQANGLIRTDQGTATALADATTSASLGVGNVAIGKVNWAKTGVTDLMFTWLKTPALRQAGQVGLDLAGTGTYALGSSAIDQKRMTGEVDERRLFVDLASTLAARGSAQLINPLGTTAAATVVRRATDVAIGTGASALGQLTKGEVIDWTQALKDGGIAGVSGAAGAQAGSMGVNPAQSYRKDLNRSAPKLLAKPAQQTGLGETPNAQRVQYTDRDTGFGPSMVVPLHGESADGWAKTAAALKNLRAVNPTQRIVVAATESPLARRFIEQELKGVVDEAHYLRTEDGVATQQYTGLIAAHERELSGGVRVVAGDAADAAAALDAALHATTQQRLAFTPDAKAAAAAGDFWARNSSEKATVGVALGADATPDALAATVAQLKHTYGDHGFRLAVVGEPNSACRAALQGVETVTVPAKSAGVNDADFRVATLAHTQGIVALGTVDANVLATTGLPILRAGGSAPMAKGSSPLVELKADGFAPDAAQAFVKQLGQRQAGAKPKVVQVQAQGARVHEQDAIPTVELHRLVNGAPRVVVLEGAAVTAKNVLEMYRTGVVPVVVSDSPPPDVVRLIKGDLGDSSLANHQTGLVVSPAEKKATLKALANDPQVVRGMALAGVRKFVKAAENQQNPNSIHTMDVGAGPRSSNLPHVRSREEFDAWAQKSGLGAVKDELWQFSQANTLVDPTTKFATERALPRELEKALGTVRRDPDTKAFYVQAEVFNLAAANKYLGASGSNELMGAFAARLKKELGLPSTESVEVRDRGPELGLLISGKNLSEAQVTEAMKRVQAGVAAEAAKVEIPGGKTLADAAHPKFPEHEAARGVGIEFGVASVETYLNPETTVKQARQAMAEASDARKPAAGALPPVLIQPKPIEDAAIVAPHEQPQVDVNGYESSYIKRKNAFIEKALAAGAKREDVERGWWEFGVAPATNGKIGFLGNADRLETAELAQQHVSRPGNKDSAYYIEGDVRNLGGLNHALGDPAMADRVFAHMSNFFREEIGALGANATFFRQGGDEISAIIVAPPGLDQAAVNAALARTQRRIEAFVNDHALNTIPHLKYADQQGTGMLFDAVPFTAGRDAVSVLKQADQAIEAKKALKK